MKVKLLLLLSILSSPFFLFGQSQGPNNPATATYSFIGCLACPGAEWDNWNNIMTADGQTADVGLNAFPNCFQTTCFYSRYLMASNFGFTIPSLATIEGIKAEIIRMTSTSPNIKDTIVQIMTQGNFGINHADTSAWTSSPVTITYGDSLDMWGLTLTPDSVNDINFGFRIMIRNASALVTFAPSSVDHIQMTVYYSISTTMFSQTRTAGGVTLYPNPATDELRIQSAELRIDKIEVYNLFGERVFEKHPTSDRGHLTISVADFPAGIYFAVIDSGTEKIRKKFIIER